MPIFESKCLIEFAKYSFYILMQSWKTREWFTIIWPNALFIIWSFCTGRRLNLVQRGTIVALPWHDTKFSCLPLHNSHIVDNITHFFQNCHALVLSPDCNALQAKDGLEQLLQILGPSIKHPFHSHRTLHGYVQKIIDAWTVWGQTITWFSIGSYIIII